MSVTLPKTELLPTRGDLPALAALAVVFGGAAIAGLQWAVVPGAGSAVWPAAGIAVAGLILGGLRLWPAIFLGRLVAALVVGSPQPWWADVLLAATAALANVLAVWLIRRTGPTDIRLSNLADLIRVAGFGILGQMAVAPVGLSILALAGTPPGQLPLLFVNSFVGSSVGVLLVAPAILAWWPADARRLSARQGLHLVACLAGVAVVSSTIFLSPPYSPFRTWHLFPVLVWAALAFSVRGAAIALIVASMFTIAAAILDLGPLAEQARTATGRLFVTQQFMAIGAATILILAAVADERRGRERLTRSEAQLRAETEALEALNETGSMIAEQMDQQALVQKVTDAGVALTGAQFGAFFYNVVRDDGGAYTLYTLSGAPRSAFETFGMPRDTEVFHPTFSGEGIVRSDDITKDPRYGKLAPHFGMPQGHLPVCSYLAAPVRSRSGEVLGGLFFGHPEPSVFTERHERFLAGLAAQAATGIDKARLYEEAQRELTQRRRAEEHQRLLINELNHRVKNTLATVQSIAHQTARTVRDPADSYTAFVERLMALSRAHDVLTKRRWEGANLEEIVQGSIQPFGGGAADRFQISGPSFWLQPSTALALAMALHELATNASKYGALSTGDGRIVIDWSIAPDADGARLTFTWRETDGPQVSAPKRKGFGSRLLERGLPADLGGTVSLDYRMEGLVCVIAARLAEPSDQARFSGG